MELKDVIFVIVLTTGLFLILKYVFIKKETTMLGKLAFAGILMSGFIILSLSRIIREHDYYEMTIFQNSYLFILLLVWLLYEYRIPTLLRKRKDKPKKNIKGWGVTKIKGMIILQAVFVLFYILLLMLLLFLTDFNFGNIFVIIDMLFILALSFSLVLYYRDIKRQGYKKEFVFLLTSNSYIQYDISKKNIFNIKKQLNIASSEISHLSYLLLNDEGNKKLIWVYHLPNYQDLEDRIFNNDLFLLLKEQDRGVIKVNIAQGNMDYELISN